MSDLIFSLNVVMPIILVVILGYVLKKMKFINKDFLSQANKLVFNVLLPVMLFVNIYNIDGLDKIRWDICLYSILGILGLFVIGLIIVILFIKDPKQKGVILQCVFRSNYAIIGIPLAEMVFPNGGAAVASIVSAVSIPVFNILAVISLTVFLKDENTVSLKDKIKDVLIKICKNPLIHGILAGLLVLLIRELFVNLNIDFRIANDLAFLDKALNWLKNITTPLALIVLGGQFEFSAIKKLWKEIILGVSFRTVIAPALGLIIAYFAYPSFDGACFAALLALFGSPVAVSSAIMATQMKNDEELAGQLVVWTTITSSFTIFAIITILKSIGIF